MCCGIQPVVLSGQCAAEFTNMNIYEGDGDNNDDDFDDKEKLEFDMIGLFVRRSGSSWVGKGGLSVVRFPDPPDGDFQVSRET